MCLFNVVVKIFKISCTKYVFVFTQIVMSRIVFFPRTTYLKYSGTSAFCGTKWPDKHKVLEGINLTWVRSGADEMWAHIPSHKNRSSISVQPPRRVADFTDGVGWDFSSKLPHENEVCLLWWFREILANFRIAPNLKALVLLKQHLQLGLRKVWQPLFFGWIWTRLRPLLVIGDVY